MSARARLQRNVDVPRLVAADPATLPRLERLYRRPGFMIRRCHQFAASIFSRAAAELGLTPSQYGSLWIVDACPGVTQIGLSGLIGLDRSTTGTVVANLARAGWLERRAHPSDGRKHCLYLTPAGQARLAAAEPAARRAYDEFLAPLDPAERDAFLTSLGKLMACHNEHARVPIVAPEATATQAERSTAAAAPSKGRRTAV